MSHQHNKSIRAGQNVDAVKPHAQNISVLVNTRHKIGVLLLNCEKVLTALSNAEWCIRYVLSTSYRLINSMQSINTESLAALQHSSKNVRHFTEVTRSKFLYIAKN